MLIGVAAIGYARKPDFEIQPPGAPTMEERIAHQLLHHKTFRDAYIAEGMNPELSVGPVLYRIREREKAARIKKEKEREAREKKSRRRERDGSRL